MRYDVYIYMLSNSALFKYSSEFSLVLSKQINKIRTNILTIDRSSHTNGDACNCPPRWFSFVELYHNKYNQSFFTFDSFFSSLSIKTKICYIDNTSSFFFLFYNRKYIYMCILKTNEDGSFEMNKFCSLSFIFVICVCVFLLLFSLRLDSID